MNIPFSPPDINEDDIQAVTGALRSGWITTGPLTKRFERELCDYFGTPKTVCLNSATACLESTLRALGIGAGDEVITCAYTYTASASVIAHVGATPVLVDTDPGSFFISPTKIAAALTEKTKAVIPIDMGGVPADYDEIFAAVQSKQGLFRANSDLQEAFGRVIVVADAAHSLGATYHGKKIGRVADFSCFSLHAVKNLTTAEGGCLTWKPLPGGGDDALYRRFMLLSLHGQSKDALAKSQAGSWRYDIACLGYKCNMTDVAAALGLSQLHRYDQMQSKRRALCDAYTKALDRPGLQLLQSSHSQSAHHLYMTRLLFACEQQRDDVITQMAQRGIATNVHYLPLPLHTAYRRLGFDMADFPHAFAQYQNEITLPLYTRLTPQQQAYIIDHYLEIIKEEGLCE